MLEAVSMDGTSDPVVRGEAAAHDEMMYWQKASQVHSP